eukprot:UN23305
MMYGTKRIISSYNITEDELYDGARAGKIKHQRQQCYGSIYWKFDSRDVQQYIRNELAGSEEHKRRENQIKRQRLMREVKMVHSRLKSAEKEYDKFVKKHLFEIQSNVEKYERCIKQLNEFSIALGEDPVEEDVALKDRSSILTLAINEGQKNKKEMLKKKNTKKNLKEKKKQDKLKKEACIKKLKVVRTKMLALDCDLKDDEWVIYVDEEDKKYSVMLGQTHLDVGHNPFYTIQIWVKTSSERERYMLVCKWGRDAKVPQFSRKDYASIYPAKHDFQEAFKKKTKNVWNEDFKPQKGKYIVVGDVVESVDKTTKNNKNVKKKKNSGRKKNQKHLKKKQKKTEKNTEYNLDQKVLDLYTKMLKKEEAEKPEKKLS